MTVFYRKRYDLVEVENTGSQLLFKFRNGHHLMSIEEANKKYVTRSNSPRFGHAIRRHAPVYVIDRDTFSVNLRDVMGREKWLSNREFEKRYEPLEPEEQGSHALLQLPLPPQPDFDIDY